MAASAAMPILPGLMSSDEPPDENEPSPATGGPDPLTEFLDQLDDAMLQELVTQAEAYDLTDPEQPSEDDGEDDAEPSDPSAADDDSDEPPADASDDSAPDSSDDDSPDSESDEGDEADPGSADLSQVEAQVNDDISQSADCVSQLEDLAGGDSEEAPSVARLLKVAQGLDEKIQRCQKDFQKAQKSEDVQAAAQAGMMARDYLEAVQALCSAAQALGNHTEAPAMKPSDHPALKMWAARTQKPAAAPPLAK